MLEALEKFPTEDPPSALIDFVDRLRDVSGSQSTQKGPPIQKDPPASFGRRVSEPQRFGRAENGLACWKRFGVY